MAITSIKRDWGVSPSIVRITTTDTLSAVGTTGYLFAQTAIINGLNAGTFQWDLNDFVLVFASDGWDLFTISPGFQSLTQFSISGAGTITSITAGAGLTGGTITHSGTIALDIPKIQKFLYNSSADTGVSGAAYIATLNPAPASLTDGLLVYLNPNNNNSVNNPTLNLNGLGAKTIVDDGYNLTPVAQQDIQAGIIAIMQYNAANDVFILLNPQLTMAALFNSQSGLFDVIAPSAGGANTYVADSTFYPGYALFSHGTHVYINVGVTNTTASTFQFAGLAALPIQLADGSALVGGEMQAGRYSLLILQPSSSAWQLVNPFAPVGATPAQVQQSAFNYAVDSSVAANAIVASISPVPASLTDGLTIFIQVANSNTSSIVTLDLNGTGAISVLFNFGTLALGDLLGGIVAVLQYSASNGAWMLLNGQVSCVSAGSLAQLGIFNYALQTNGSTTDYVAPSNSYDGITPTSGLYVYLLPAQTNTGATTLNYAGTSAIPVLYQGNPLVGGEILANHMSLLSYNGTSYDLLNTYLVAGGVTASQVQLNAFNLGTGAGSPDAAVVNLTPAPGALTDGLTVTFFPVGTNTITNPTLDLNGLGATQIFYNGGLLLPGDLTPIRPVTVIYSSVFPGWILQNPTVSLAQTTQIQNQGYTFVQDTGSADNYALTLSPAPLAYTDGQLFWFVPQNSNTGASVINVNGLGNVAITHQDFSPLLANELVNFHRYEIIFSGGANGFILINPEVTLISPAQIQASTYLVATSNSGSANIYTAAMTPTLTSLGAGTMIIFSPVATNTNVSGVSPATLNVDGLGAKNLMISSLDSAAIPVFAGGLIVGNSYEAMYDGTQWIVLNPSNLVTGELLVAQSWTYAPDSGAVNAYVITLPTVLVNSGVILAGTKVSFSTSNASTGASTLTVNGSTNSIVTNATGGAIGVGDILAGAIYEVTFDGANWRLLDSTAGVAGGAYIESIVLIGAAITLVDDTAADVTSISLTAGDWDVWGTVVGTAVATNTDGMLDLFSWISTTSTTQPDNSLTFATGGAVLNTAGGNILFSQLSGTTYQRINIVTTTTVYLSCQSSFAGTAPTACGKISARLVA